MLCKETTCTDDLCRLAMEKSDNGYMRKDTTKISVSTESKDRSSYYHQFPPRQNLSYSC